MMSSGTLDMNMSSDESDDGVQPLPKTPPSTKSKAQKTMNTKKVIKCKHCEKTFSNIGNFKRHSHANKSFQCSVCGKKFANKYSIEVHRRGHASTYKCPHCDKKLFSPVGLKMHKQTHEPSQQKQFSCEKCHSYKSDSRFNFNRHREKCVDKDAEKVVQKAVPPKAQCQICGKLMNSSSIRRHVMKLHNNQS